MLILRVLLTGTTRYINIDLIMSNDKKDRFILSGFLMALLILAIGVVLDSVLGQFSWFKPTWPTNVYVYSIIIFLGLAIGAISNSVVLRQLASGKSMMPSIVILLIAALLLMIFPLGEGIPYFSLINGLPLTFLLVYLFFVSGLYLSLHFSKIKGVGGFNVVAMIGLLIFLFATINGQNDYYKMEMKTGKNRAIFNGRNHDGKVLRTPFALKFLDLSLQDERVYIAAVGTEEHSEFNAEDAISEDSHYNVNDCVVNVKSMYLRAVSGAGGFIEKDTINSVTAAYISVKDKAGVELSAGWVCSGSDGQLPVLLDVPGKSRVGIIIPNNQPYSASFRLFDTVSKYEDYSLGQGESIGFKGWDISVVGFDQRYGHASPVIDFKLIFDRWLETRYVGLALLLIGLVLIAKFKPKHS